VKRTKHGYAVETSESGKTAISTSLGMADVEETFKFRNVEATFHNFFVGM
jgi:hypothetical protein